MIRGLATFWIFFVLLVAPAFATPVCRVLLFSEWFAPPAGFTAYQGDNCCRVYLRDGTTTAWWQSMNMTIALDGGPLGIEWTGVSGPGSYVIDLTYCADSADDACGVVTSTWEFVGWDDGVGGWSITSPPEGATYPSENLVLDHGVQCAGTGTGCIDCGGGGPDPDPGNTNQFHLDVTNKLASIETTLSNGFASLTNGLDSSTQDARATVALGRFESFVATVTNLIENNPAWEAYKEEGNLAGTLPSATPASAPWFTIRVGSQVLDVGLIFDDSLASATDMVGILRTIVAFTAAMALFLTITWENKNVVLSAMQMSKGTVIGRNTAAAVPGLGVAVASVVVLSLITLIITIPTWMAFTGAEVFPKLGVPIESAAELSNDPFYTLTALFIEGNAMWAQLWIRFLQFCPLGVIITAIVNYWLYLRVQNTVQILFYAIMKHIPV